MSWGGGDGLESVGSRGNRTHTQSHRCTHWGPPDRTRPPDGQGRVLRGDVLSFRRGSDRCREDEGRARRTLCSLVRGRGSGEKAGGPVLGVSRVHKGLQGAGTPVSSSQLRTDPVVRGVDLTVTRVSTGRDPESTWSPRDSQTTRERYAGGVGYYTDEQPTTDTRRTVQQTSDHRKRTRTCLHTMDGSADVGNSGVHGVHTGRPPGPGPVPSHEEKGEEGQGWGVLRVTHR